MEMRCGCCKWWQDFEDGDPDVIEGWCRINPPVICVALAQSQGNGGGL